MKWNENIPVGIAVCENVRHKGSRYSLKDNNQNAASK